MPDANDVPGSSYIPDYSTGSAGDESKSEP